MPEVLQHRRNRSTQLRLYEKSSVTLVTESRQTLGEPFFDPLNEGEMSAVVTSSSEQDETLEEVDEDGEKFGLRLHL